MAQDIIDGINPTRMELLSLKNRTKLAVKGHGLLKEKRDALIKEFFDILDRVKGVREAAEKSLKEANEALLEAQIAMGDLAVRKASLSVKESIDVDIKSRSVMGVSVPVTNVKMEERSIIDRGYSLADTTIQLDEAAKKFEDSIKFLIELGEVEKTIFLLAEEIEATKRRVNALEHIMIPRFENTEKYIDMRLQEMERENFVRLKMIRSTIEKKDNESKEVEA
ncbi:V-type ATP synthase subunit D [uncultured Methanobrevibacter sp.]|uniref:V-type ATP synthase subunit D n=1 Tax=uncultured Methanobrevibacter sp. TaxID=253161 RepID=UPI002613A851|nr:V-type ATP synthase subunit D [uncultured Methanobrevibacter sp.]